MRHVNRRGFAIPTALLVITLLTIALAAAFTLLTSERRTSDDQQSSVRALGIAQQGIEAYLRHPDNPAFRPGRPVYLPPRDNDTAWVPIGTSDTAIVIPRLVHAAIGGTDTSYVVSSLGRQGANGVRGTPQAQRAVAEIVSWQGAAVPIKAGWLSLSGVSKNGASGTLSGLDAASPGCASAGTLAGVSVPTTVTTSSGSTIAGYTGSTAPLSGNPPLDNSSLGNTPQAAAVTLAQTGIRWDRWSQGLDLPNVWRVADHGGAFPDFSNPSYYPTVYVNGDLPDLPDGRGLLVVSGSLTMNGLTHWDGIVLIGGAVTANGNDNVQGTVLSGLNLMLDSASVGVASLGNGTKTIQYNSCSVQKALAGTKALVPRRGTWTDTWRTY